MIFAAGATPAIPTPLPVAAAAMPDTCVPCTSAAAPLPSGPLQSPLPHGRCPLGQPVNVAPVTSWPCRSGWLRSTPVSTTAITAPAPVLFAHACDALIWVRPHCLAYSGSLVAACDGVATAATAATAIPAARYSRVRVM